MNLKAIKLLLQQDIQQAKEYSEFMKENFNG